MRGAAIAAFSLFVSAGSAAASPFDEVRVGALVHGFGAIQFEKEDGAALNAELLFHPLEGLSFIGAPRPHLGISAATNDGTSIFYTGLTWEQRLGRFFIDGGFGIAFHDGRADFSPTDPNINTTAYLGCRALFHLSGDLGVMLGERISASLYTEHVSNAGLCSENEGLDNSGVRLGVRF